MEIPAFFVSYEKGDIIATDGYFSSVAPKAGSRSFELRQAISECMSESERPPVVVVDCNSFENRGFSEKVMKHLRIPSTEIWFMTCIRTVDDVFDAFNKDASFVLAPYHFIESDAELRDICDVSDSFVPVISVHKSKAILPKGKSADVLSVLEKLVSIGFYRNCILDSERSLDGYSWSVIREDYPSTVPIVDRPEDAEGFQTFIAPHML